MLRSLQIGRGIAALAVAAFHLSIVISETSGFEGNLVWSVTQRGNLGVDYFFVLSGFIIAYAHQGDIGQPNHLKTYALKRLVRVWPVYWFFTFVVLAGAALTGGDISPPTRLADWATMISLIRWTDYAPPIGAS